MTNYRANGKLARTDWTHEMDRDLLSVKFTPTHKRVHGRGPDAFSDVAKKYGKTLVACHMRFNRVRRKSGLTGAWVTEGLWADWEDDLIWSRIGTGRVVDGTWVSKLQRNPPDSDTKCGENPRL